jgi:predicted small secreted protein
MRKRNLMIGAVVGVAGSLAIAGIASAVVDSQTYSSVAAKSKQDKKVRGPVGQFVTNVDTQYSGTFSPPATQTVLTFDRDFKFNSGKLAQCNLASLAGKDAAGARAACPKAIVGQGSAVIRTLAGGTLNAIVSAFNGVKSGGNSTIYLHTDVQGSTTKPILTGTLQGNTLVVQVPVTPGTAIVHFDTTINQIVSLRKKNKNTGKTVKTFYVSARCSDGQWDHSETTTYQGGVTKSAAFSQKCKKKATKK